MSREIFSINNFFPGTTKFRLRGLYNPPPLTPLHTYFPLSRLVNVKKDFFYLGSIKQVTTIIGMYYKITIEGTPPPRVGSAYAAGLDLALPTDIIIPKHSALTIDLGISVELPKGTYGQLAVRSSIAKEHWISLLGGVIDEDYRGNIKAILYNPRGEALSFLRGDRLVQIIAIKYNKVCPEKRDVLSTSKRNDNGFGSSGRR